MSPNPRGVTYGSGLYLDGIVGRLRGLRAHGRMLLVIGDQRPDEEGDHDDPQRRQNVGDV